jgi:antibiotic biosynthesis monooxygenase (ABM) superfamily enzyme
VILVSGAGLLLLSMTNRFGRIIDRSREIVEALRSTQEGESELLISQLRILVRRAHLVRIAIALVTLSVLLAAVLIIVIFLTALFRLDAALLIVLLFTACMVSLIAALIFFMRDVNASLAAFQLEVGLGSETDDRKR